MKGFITWLRKEPQFADLARDAGPVSSFKGLLKVMFACNACEPAWAMLYAAVKAWPGALPRGWSRDMFDGDVPQYLLDVALYEYATGAPPDAWPDTMPADEFEAFLLSGKDDPTQPLTPAQECRVWAARK